MHRQRSDWVGKLISCLASLDHALMILSTGMFTDKRRDDRVRMMRRNVVRYVILSYCIALRTVSFKLKKRFPSLDHLVSTGVMREDELSLFRQLDDKVINIAKLL